VSKVFLIMLYKERVEKAIKREPVMRVIEHAGAAFMNNHIEEPDNHSARAPKDAPILRAMTKLEERALALGANKQTIDARFNKGMGEQLVKRRP
jgi:hypothetical protein